MPPAPLRGLLGHRGFLPGVLVHHALSHMLTWTEIDHSCGICEGEGPIKAHVHPTGREPDLPVVQVINLQEGSVREGYKELCSLYF